MTAIIVSKDLEERIAQIPAPPRDYDLNGRFRDTVLDMGGNDSNWAAAFKEKCKRDELFWYDTFCYTRDAKWRPGEAHVRMIPYDKQREYIGFRNDMRASGSPHCLVKSREQGASIVMCYDNQYHWQFHGTSTKIGSEKKDKVDGKSFETALLPKVEYNLSMQPQWLLPDGFELSKPFRTFNNFFNPETSKSYSGEPTNEDFARGDRLSNIDIDEASAIPILAKIHLACGNATRCWAFISTPRGYEYFAATVHKGDVPVFYLPWWENEAWFGWTDENGTKQPGLRYCKPGCKVHEFGGKPHSDRYDSECRSYGYDPVKIAQELDMDFAKSGNALFNTEVVKKVRVFLSERKPKLIPVGLEWSGQTSEISLSDPNGWFKQARRWSVAPSFEPMSGFRILSHPFLCENKECPCEGTGRHTLVNGGDVAKGLEHGDNNVLLTLDITAGKFVAAYQGRKEADLTAVDWAKISRFFGKAAGNDCDVFSNVEWNDNGVIVNRFMGLMGTPLARHKSDDKIRGESIPDKQGTVVHVHNRARLLNEYLLPYLGRSNGPGGFPRLIMPFDEFWQEAETLVLLTPEAGILNPERPKAGAMRGKHDDWLWAATHAIYVAMRHYGKVKGCVRRNQVLNRENNPVLQRVKKLWTR